MRGQRTSSVLGLHTIGPTIGPRSERIFPAPRGYCLMMSLSAVFASLVATVGLSTAPAQADAMTSGFEAIPTIEVSVEESETALPVYAGYEADWQQSND